MSQQAEEHNTVSNHTSEISFTQTLYIGGEQQNSSTGISIRAPANLGPPPTSKQPAQAPHTKTPTNASDFCKFSLLLRNRTTVLQHSTGGMKQLPT
mmetsp:Transcript_4657/g.17535  ORF Transcript_4657/g.17535 Transcript_4657/m.17535 type:complete len:96 (-) Transcript_4657:241-528(-)